LDLEKLKETMLERDRGASLEQISEEVELEHELQTIKEVEEESPQKQVFEFDQP
jgi:hypothetical protein